MKFKLSKQMEEKMELVLNNLKLHLRKGNYGPDRLYRL